MVVVVVERVVPEVDGAFIGAVEGVAMGVCGAAMGVVVFIGGGD